MLVEDSANKALIPSLCTWTVKWLSGFLLSFVVAVMGMSVFGYKTFSFIFVFTAVQIFFWKWFHKSSLITILVFDAAVVFTLLMFRLYVILGPNI